MIFTETPLPGAYIIEPTFQEDERGAFGRSWCQREFEEQGLNPRLVQSSISLNKLRGTLRGMHYQAAPFAEVKLVRCTAGIAYDVLIDLRSDSMTFKHWFAIELTAENHRALYVPEGFAHGFQTLTDGTEMLYQMSEFFHAEASHGFRWNDPAFGVKWPIEISSISDKDRSFPDWDNS